MLHFIAMFYCVKNHETKLNIQPSPLRPCPSLSFTHIISNPTFINHVPFFYSLHAHPHTLCSSCPTLFSPFLYLCMHSLPFFSFFTVLALPSHPLFSCYLPFFLPTFPSLCLFTYLALPSFLFLCPALLCFIDAYPTLLSPPLSTMPSFPFSRLAILTFPSLFFTLPCPPLLAPPLITCHAFFYVFPSPSFLSIFACLAPCLALPHHAPFDQPYLTLPCLVLSLSCPTLPSFSQPPWSCWSNNTFKTLGKLLAKETTQQK